MNNTDPLGLIGFKKFFKDHGVEIAVTAAWVGAVACAATVACGVAVASTLGIAGFATAGAATVVSGGSAQLTTSAVNLGRSLASEEQMAGDGEAIAGEGCKAAFRGAADAAARYGGNAADWVKMRSGNYTDQTGRNIETHWIENVVTNVREEFKTKLWPF